MQKQAFGLKSNASGGLLAGRGVFFPPIIFLSPDNCFSTGGKKNASYYNKGLLEELLGAPWGVRDAKGGFEGGWTPPPRGGTHPLKREALLRTLAYLLVFF